LLDVQTHQETSVNDRWNAQPRFWLHSTVAGLALACGSGIDGPADPDGDDAPPVIVRDTCADNSLLAGCEGPDLAAAPNVDGESDPGSNPAPSNSELELARAAAENVLRANCGQCHGPLLTPAAARAGMNFIDDIDALVNQGKLVPLSSEESPVVRRMRDGSMPPLGTNGPRPSDRDIEIVADFVDDPLFWPEYRPPPSCEGQRFTFDQLYEAVQRDVRAFDSDDRESLRYVTLTNRYNAGACADTLDRERFAIIKLVNMLSTRASIRTPEPIDGDRLIYRINLRDYNWDREVEVGGTQFRDGWEAIIASSPYAVPFVGDQAEDVRADTLTDVPVMNADALLDVAALGDLYYGLIGVDVGQSFGAFISNDLGIDVEDNIADGDAVRAGTTRSAISRQDRVVERHEIGVRQGILWQSFDFAADDAGQSIFSDPFSFNQGGTEAIFSLPNGMLGFIIADENDNIVGESDILLDTFQNDFVARTSVSCSNCHAQGFNPVVDEVGPFVLANRLRFVRDDFEAVSEVYVDPADFAEIIEQDSSLFLQSLQRAGLPTTGSDPVAGAFVRFNVDVDLAVAAGDLGVTPEELRDNLNLLDPALSALRQTTIERQNFTAAFEQSLCIMQGISNNAPDPDRCDALLD
jgi:mono/diheme cytochrome c family protein